MEAAMLCGSAVLRRSLVARIRLSAYRPGFEGNQDSVPIPKGEAEFEFTLVFADAPIDKFARGLKNAMTADEKRGAILFFGSANCVSCHAVAGQLNEMFSDFRQHVAGIPQIAPAVGNVTFDGPGANEDFGLEQVTGNPNDRYAFRSSPLRNLALQPTFFHNGSFTRLEDAVRYHLDAITTSRPPRTS